MFLICTTSDNIPEWVARQAKDLGIQFIPLSLSSRHAVEQIGEIQPHGYLMNGPPDYGPYLDAGIADASPNLRLVTYFGQSLEPSEYETFLDFRALAARGIAITTTPGATESVAEGAIALLLALNLDLVSHSLARKADRELTVQTRTGLYENRLGIVGMGQIGRRVAEIARSLGMEIFYTSRSPKPAVERDLGAQFVDLPTLFRNCPNVSIHTPSSVTEGLIDDEILAHSRGTTLLNTTSVARIVEPVALLNALEDKRIARVGIEGRYPEPYDSRLRAFGDDRVLLLPPYTSWDTERSWRTGWERYLETLESFVSGAELPYQLTAR